MLLLICLPVQNYLGSRPNGMSFRIVDSSSTLKTDATTQNREMVRASESRVACPQKLRQAAQWLVNVLSDGERRASEVQSKARELGFAPRTLRSAVVGLNIHFQQELIEGARSGFRNLPQTRSRLSREPSDHLPRPVPDTISERHAKTSLTNAAHARNM